MTTREKRTVRIAGTAIAIYLVLFFGLRVWKNLESRRENYQRLVRDAGRLRREIEPYERRNADVAKLKETFRIDPLKLSRTTLVADASAAIQKAAQAAGVQLGPIRETAARATAREMTSVQLEGLGPVPAILGLLHRFETLGYPLVFDSIQLSSDPTKPGMLKLNLTIVILDFEQWKNEDLRNA